MIGTKGCLVDVKKMPPYKERLKQLEINMKNEGGELPSRKV